MKLTEQQRGQSRADRQMVDQLCRPANKRRSSKPLELKQMIQANEVSATYASELFREHGEAAVRMLKEAEAREGEEKCKKLTRKKVEKKNSPKIGKKVVEAMHKSVSSITKRLDTIKKEGDSFTLTLTRNDVEDLHTLREKLAELEGELEGKASEKQQELSL